MTDRSDIWNNIEAVAIRQGSFKPDAYIFVLEALETVMADMGERRHVSGQDLLEGIRKLARERFGLMARDVLADWGVRTTLDFGRIVFHLVDAELLSRRDEDTLADFIDKYDFREAFELDYFQGKA